MTELRWILLLVGILLVVGVFLYTRWQQTRQQKSNKTHAPRQEPDYDLVMDDSIATDDGLQNDDFLMDADTPAPEPEPRIPDTDSTPPDPGTLTGNQKIFTIHVMAPEGSTFAAQEVVNVLQAAGLKYGKYGIFHLDVPVGGAARTVFSAADMVEPGTFDLGKLEDNWLIGITLFMVLPGPRSGVDAFAQMLSTARQLAEKLDGEVMDASHSSLTRQTAHHMREQIIAFEAKAH